MHYFVRANGDTAHNDPNRKEYFVPGEPPAFPKTFFNYVPFCLEQGIARIGWPDTGDLLGGSKQGALARGYDLQSVKPHVRGYLEAFREIDVDDTVVMPLPPGSGASIYIGTVIRPYHYFRSVPLHPYECAHRVGVDWDRDPGGEPRLYACDAAGIDIHGGFWVRAFQIIDRASEGPRVIERLTDLRSAG